MIKKKYMKPAMMTEFATVEHMLAESIASVNTTGLDDDLVLPDEDKSGNPWENAW